MTVVKYVFIMFTNHLSDSEERRFCHGTDSLYMGYFP